MKKTYITRAPEMRLSATKLMSTVVLIWFASTLWTTIIQQLGVTSDKGFLAAVLSYVSPAAGLVACIIAYVAFSREEQATLLEGKKENKLMSVMMKLVIVDLIMTAIILIAYKIADGLIPAMLSSASYSAQQRLVLTAAVQTKAGAVSNILGKIFSVQLLYTVYAFCIFKKELSKTKLKQFSLAAAVISAVSLALLIINYIMQFALSKNAVLSATANYSVYAVYIALYLMFDARTNVCKKQLSTAKGK